MKLTDISVSTDGSLATVIGHPPFTCDAVTRVALANGQNCAPLYPVTHTDISRAVESVRTTGASTRAFTPPAGTLDTDGVTCDEPFGDDEMTCLLPARVGADGAPARVTSREH